jgi:hypothetical protein
VDTLRDLHQLMGRQRGLPPSNRRASYGRVEFLIVGDREAFIR